jgi:hypothetical protein
MLALQVDSVRRGSSSRALSASTAFGLRPGSWPQGQPNHSTRSGPVPRVAVPLAGLGSNSSTGNDVSKTRPRRRPAKGTASVAGRSRVNGGEFFPQRPRQEAPILGKELAQDKRSAGHSSSRIVKWPPLAPPPQLGRRAFACSVWLSACGAWRSLVSALVWGTRGPEFKSRRPDRGRPCKAGPSASLGRLHGFQPARVWNRFGTTCRGAAAPLAARRGSDEPGLSRSRSSAPRCGDLYQRKGRDGALGIVQGEHALGRIEFAEQPGTCRVSNAARQPT